MRRLRGHPHPPLPQRKKYKVYAVNCKVFAIKLSSSFSSGIERYSPGVKTSNGKNSWTLAPWSWAVVHRLQQNNNKRDFFSLPPLIYLFLRLYSTGYYNSSQKETLGSTPLTTLTIIAFANLQHLWGLQQFKKINLSTAAPSTQEKLENCSWG